MIERVEIRHDGEVRENSLPIGTAPAFLAGVWVNEEGGEFCPIEDLEGVQREIEKLQEVIANFLSKPISHDSLKQLAEAIDYD